MAGADQSFFEPNRLACGAMLEGTEQPPAWTALLQRAIEGEILPSLLGASEPQVAFDTSPSGWTMPQPDIEGFVALILANDLERAAAVVDRVIVQAGGRGALLRQLLTPAARHLGLLWERDLCDFLDVTLGVQRLDRFMKETEFSDGQTAILHQHDYRALLMPAPGEQHSFGIGMVADVFREAGWCVRSGPAVARSRLVRLVQDEWFDIVGLSISSERWLGSLASCVRAVRQASCNVNVIVVLGGSAIVGHEERSRFLGADMVAIDAYQALEDCNVMLGKLAGGQSPRPFRQFS